MPSITQKMIAEKAGVTPATVSKALNNHPDIAPETKELIKGIAEDNGYVPNIMASSLGKLVRKKFNATIAILFGHPNQHPLENHPVYNKILEGIRDRAEQLGFDLDVIWIYDPSYYGRDLDEILRNRGVTGVIPVRVDASEHQVCSESYAYCSAGAIKVDQFRSKTHYTTWDMYYTMLELLDTLANKQVKAVGYLSEQLNCEKQHRWRMLAAYEQYVKEDSAMVCAPHFKWDSELEELISSGGASGAFEQFVAWIRTYDIEVVILRALRKNSTIALWVVRIEAMKELSVHFVILDAEDTSYSGMYLPYSAMGAAAVDVVAAQLSRNELGVPQKEHIKQVCLSSTWHASPNFPY